MVVSYERAEDPGVPREENDITTRQPATSLPMNIPSQKNFLKQASWLDSSTKKFIKQNRPFRGR